MSFDIKLNRDGDVELEGFELVLNVAGAESVAQKLLITLRAYRGEFFLDQLFGTGWYQVILGKGNSKSIVDQEIRKVINGVEGVAQIVSYQSELDAPSRTMSVTFQIRTSTAELVEGSINEGGDVVVMVV